MESLEYTVLIYLPTNLHLQADFWEWGLFLRVLSEYDKQSHHFANLNFVTSLFFSLFTTETSSYVFVWSKREWSRSFSLVWSHWNIRCLYISPLICTYRLIFENGAFFSVFFLNMTSNPITSQIWILWRHSSFLYFTTETSSYGFQFPFVYFDYRLVSIRLRARNSEGSQLLKNV